MERLRHVGGPILRPSVQRYREELSHPTLAQRGLATAVRKDSLPWTVALTETVSGGDFWSTDAVLPVANGWSGIYPSLGDSFTAITPYWYQGPLDYHHLVIEAPVSDDPPGPACTLVDSGNRRLLYRRGDFADVSTSKTIDGSTLFEVAHAELDHGTLALTEDSGATTAHVVYWRIGDGQTFHWWHNDVLGTGGVTLTVPPPGFSIPAQPAGVFSDAGNNAYAWAALLPPTLCRLSPPPAPGACADMPGAINVSPPPWSQDVLFPAVGSPDPYATCSGSRCFDTQEPFDIVASATVANRLYAVYQGEDAQVIPHRSSVYFTWRLETNPVSVWAATVRVNTRVFGDNREFIDPSITASSDGTLVVTYSAADNPEPGLVDQYIAYSIDNGATWTEHKIAVAWDPNELPFHCSRPTGFGPGKFFLGEYRDGHRFGARAYNTHHLSASGHTVLTGHWSSRWSVYPY